jgi:YD repeat-containing protein
LVFQFDIIEIWSDLPPTPLLHKLDDADQKMLELVLLEKPVYSALEPPAFEIIKADLVLRSRNPVASTNPQQTMHFLDWDDHGRKGTTAHALTSFGVWLIDYLDSGIWAMFMFILAIIALFVLVCVLCVFGWGFWEDDYAQAQHGKAKEGKRRGKSDVEIATRLPFRSAEELGLSRGRVVGLGKSD